MSLTTLLGTLNDEQVGNNSYVGALATLSDADLGRFTHAYYVLRHHGAVVRTSPATLSLVVGDTAHVASPGQLSTLLHDALSRDMSATTRAALATAPLRIEGVQSFRVAGDAPRNYVRAKLRSDSACTRVSEWVVPAPAVRLLAIETGSCRFDNMQDDPALLDVVELTPGESASWYCSNVKTVSSSGSWSIATAKISRRCGCFNPSAPANNRSQIGARSRGVWSASR